MMTVILSTAEEKSSATFRIGFYLPPLGRNRGAHGPQPVPIQQFM